jgi:solute carrier family 8 (sodium/calcium exchanger)
MLAFKDGDDPENHMTEKKRIAMEAYHKAREKNPHADATTLQHLVEQENLRLQHKSRAFYRIQANKSMTGQGNIMRQKKPVETAEEKRVSDEEMEMKQLQQSGLPVPPTEGCIVYFHPAELTVVESCGNVYLNVVRVGADLFDTIYVDYQTSEGTATVNADYIHTEGTLVFKPGETSKTIVIPIVDDDIFELDEYFFCKLTGVRCEPGHGRHPPRISEPATATITVLDDDYPGVFTFEQDTTEVAETCGFLTMRIVRLIGARGIIRVPYYTEEGSASGGGEDFEDIVGEIEFQDEETVKTVEIQIVDREEYEKNKSFNVVLGEPRIVKIENQTKISNLESVEDLKLRAILEAGRPTLGMP